MSSPSPTPTDSCQTLAQRNSPHGILYRQELVTIFQPKKLFPGLVKYPLDLCPKHCWELYGLKQAPQEWYPRLSSRLLDLGFANFKSNTSLFIYRTSSELILFLINVDEIIVTSLSSSSISRLIKTLQSDFALKDLGPLHFFLRVEAINIDSGLFLSQRRYISDLRKPTCITKPISSPIASNKTLKSIYWEFIR
uniref:Reverse transcriptase Ty1/copia-type domain-containing protein n=1 Tax=Quercus lobata TaxID=97700 RepID=A0A7N2LN31_QUELO